MIKAIFNLDYRTQFGERLVLNVRNGQQTVEHYEMDTVDGALWTAEVMLPAEEGTFIDYYYSVWRDEQELRQEWLVEPHRLEFVKKGGEQTGYTVFDHWIDTPEDSYLYSSAFTDCVMARERSKSPVVEFSRTVRLKVRAPQLRSDHRLAIVGEPEQLGAWKAECALPMTEHECHEWVVSLDADRLPRRFEFKFVLVKSDGTEWEHCMNRVVSLPEIDEDSVVVYELPQAFFGIWAWRGAGTVIPVFSLRSEGSFGVGDFGDLKQMVDWCEKTHQRILQVLPINDTNMTGSWQDSYPYNSISIFALHPQYTDLRQLPPLNDEALRNKYEELRKELNALPQIDYERVFAAKMEYLHEVYRQEWANVKGTQSYADFFEANKDWLEPYARFCCYRDLYRTAEFSQWPSPLATPDAEVLEFWYFVQFNLDQQMRAAHEYARRHRVILKGDIPIGISRDGVEAWAEPRYFNLNGQAGAPPDAFSDDGQNWGFPTYNWDVMLSDGCQWWVRRFRKMQEYFDAYRIDHVLGFFRIWEIPMPEKSGLYGQFQPSLPMSIDEIEQRWHLPFRQELYLEDHKQKNTWHPRINALKMSAYQQLDAYERWCFKVMYDDYFYRRNNQYWYEEAMKKLPRLTQATRMLCCAEDLGMVPDCVPWVMNQLRILSLEIQSMPKETGLRFGILDHNPYRSVDTISTHDMSTLRQWWDEDLERAQNYFNSVLCIDGPAPHPLPGWLARQIVSRHLSWPSMLCLLSLQDWLSIDEHLRLPDADAERINIPANPRHYWRYRMHLTIEQLLASDDFNAQVSELIENCGRK